MPGITMDLSLEFPLSSNMVNSCVYDLETKDIPFSRRSFESSFHVRMPMYLYA